MSSLMVGWILCIYFVIVCIIIEKTITGSGNYGNYSNYGSFGNNGVAITGLGALFLGPFMEMTGYKTGDFRTDIPNKVEVKQLTAKQVGQNIVSFTPELTIPYEYIPNSINWSSVGYTFARLNVYLGALTLQSDVSDTRKAEIALARATEISEERKNIKYFYHYTDFEGYIGILSTRAIFPNSKGKVYVTDATLNSVEAFQNLFLNAKKTHNGRGDYVIMFGLRQDQISSLENNISDPYEYIYRGTLRIYPNALKYAGPNPF